MRADPVMVWLCAADVLCNVEVAGPGVACPAHRHPVPRCSVCFAALPTTVVEPAGQLGEPATVKHSPCPQHPDALAIFGGEP